MPSPCEKRFSSSELGGCTSFVPAPALMIALHGPRHGEYMPVPQISANQTGNTERLFVHLHSLHPVLVYDIVHLENQRRRQLEHLSDQKELSL